MSPVKRGDLVALVETVRTTYVHDAPTVRERVTLARVTSVTRDGIAKVAVAVEDDRPCYSPRDVGRVRVLRVPSDALDAPALVAAYSARRYPTAPHSPMVPPFDSLEAARAFVSQFIAAS